MEKERKQTEINESLKPFFGDPGIPIVSVLIFNYNYGHFLRECFESVITQTYKNIEINFSDNASTDDSWEIALEYARKYPGKITLTQNRINFGVDANFKNCISNVRGKYFIELCSDDALASDYIEKCVSMLEKYPNAGFAMVHRTIINEHGNKIEEPPFYNQSCLIPGAEQAAVYMMAAVNPSVSQIMYRTGVFYNKSMMGTIAARWYCTRSLDFNICLEHDIIYIKAPLLLQRLHLQNDSFKAAANLLEVLGPYALQYLFTEIAKIHNRAIISERLPKSLEKLSKLCLRYCVRALICEDERNALRYYHLSVAIIPDIVKDKVFIELKKYWKSDSSTKNKIRETFKSAENLATRSVSYDPPQGALLLKNLI